MLRLDTVDLIRYGDPHYTLQPANCTQSILIASLEDCLFLQLVLAIATEK